MTEILECVDRRRIWSSFPAMHSPFKEVGSWFSDQPLENGVASGFQHRRRLTMNVMTQLADELVNIIAPSEETNDVWYVCIEDCLYRCVA